MNKTQKIRAEFLREALNYDQNTGELTWKTRPLKHFKDERRMKIFNTKFSGKVAGNLGCHGYLGIRFTDYGLIPNHRIAFCIHHGYIPTMIDHVNGNKADNRIVNLRPATSSQNNMNRVSSRNRSGVIGVSFDSRTQTWRAQITINKTPQNIGRFKNMIDATAARKNAEMHHHGEFAISNRI